MSTTQPSIGSPSSSHAAQGLPKVAWGKGIHVYDASGKRYIDASGGPVVYLPRAWQRGGQFGDYPQLSRIAHGYRYVFTSEPLEQLRELIAAACGPNLVRWSSSRAARRQLSPL